MKPFGSHPGRWPTAALATAVALAPLSCGAPSDDAEDASDEIETSSRALGSQSPYGGAAWAAPGTIQAENFDNGGEGVAYHDVDSTNLGGAYRTGGVDLQSTTDVGGGVNVGWTKPGEWLEYTIDVTTNGTYAVSVRVASHGSGGTLHVEVDGADKTGPMKVPDTGGWQTWTTLTHSGVALSAGSHVLRLAFDAAGSNGYVGNVNKVILAGSAMPPPPSGTLLYNADFENGAWPSGTTFEQCASGRIKVYSSTTKPPGAPAPRRGTHAVAFTVLDTDVDPCTPTGNPRASAYKQGLLKPGQEVWEAWSLFVPSGFPSVPYFMMFQEDYGYPFHSTPPNGFYLQNFDGTGNRFFVTGDYDPVAKTAVRVWDAPVAYGVWHDWLVHRKLALDTSGFLEVWLDGQAVTFDNNSTHLGGQHTMLAGATSANFGVIHYRKAGMFPVANYPNGLTLYFDEVRAGTTRDVVEIPPP